MDAASLIIIITLIIGMVSLLIERSFSWAARIKHSDCLGSHFEMSEAEPAKTPTAPSSPVIV